MQKSHLILFQWLARFPWLWPPTHLKPVCPNHNFQIRRHNFVVWFPIFVCFCFVSFPFLSRRKRISFTPFTGNGDKMSFTLIHPLLCQFYRVQPVEITIMPHPHLSDLLPRLHIEQILYWKNIKSTGCNLWHCFLPPKKLRLTVISHSLYMNRAITVFNWHKAHSLSYISQAEW